MSVFKIRCRCDDHMLNFIRTFEKLDYGVCKINADFEFSKSCLEKDLCPTFLHYKMSAKWLQSSEFE